MPDIEDSTFFYEFLVRGNPDGTIGAHLQERRIVKINGEVLVDQLLDPIPIDPTSPVFAETATMAMAKAIAAAQQAQADLDQANVNLEIVTAERDDLAEHVMIAADVIARQSAPEASPA